MLIRDVVEKDLPEIGEIAKKAFDDYSVEDYLKMSKDPNYNFVVAESAGSILGFLMYLKIDDELEIIKIATDEKFKRQGVATKLIESMRDFGLKFNHSGIILEVNEINESARKLYEKAGFKQIHVRKKYYHGTEDAIIMELKF